MTTTLPRRYHAPAAILAAALVIRVVIVVVTRHTYLPTHDAADFNRIATSLAHGHGYGPTAIPGVKGPSAFRTPALPFVLAAVYWVVGIKVTAARLALAVLSTIVVALIGAIADRLLGRRAGLIALTIAAVYPPLLLASYGLNYETVMGVAVLATLLCVLVWRDHPNSWWWLAATGVCAGASIYCRENAGLVLVPVVIMIWQALPTATRQAVIARVATVIVIAAVVVVPWTIRNAAQLHEFIPVSDSPGIALAGTYNPLSPSYDAEWIPFGGPPDAHILASAIAQHRNEAQVSSRYQSAALSYAAHHPLYIVKAAFYNTLRLFDLRGPNDSNWLAPLIGWPVAFVELAVVSFYLLGAFALFGVVTRHVRGIPWALWTFPALWALSIILSTSIMQYRYIIEPFVVLLAAATLADLIRPAAKEVAPTTSPPHLRPHQARP